MTVEAIPTVKEELNRKVTDVLVELAEAREQKLRPPEEIAAAALAIWFAVAGLVDSDVLNAAGKLAESCKTGLMAKHFVGHGKVVSLYWRATSNGYTVQYRNAADNSVSSQAKPVEIGLRDAEIATLTSKLKTAGYHQLI